MNVFGGRIVYLHQGLPVAADLNLSPRQSLPALDIVTAEESCPAPGAPDARRLRIALEPHEEIELVELTLEASCVVQGHDRIFLNGFQSWTESREHAPDERIPTLARIARGAVAPFGDAFIHACQGLPGVLHGFTYTYVRRGEHFELVGSVTERGGYTILEAHTKESVLFIKKDVAGLVLDQPLPAYDLLFASGDERAVFDAWFDAMGPLPEAQPVRSGWTSWYNHYTRISEDIILKNLEAFRARRSPIELFQIDDGYQQALGDWLVPNAKFPHGMGALASKIKDAGYRAGIWLAPFVADKKGSIWKHHRDWFATDDEKKPRRAGYNPWWNGDFFALDVDHPEVRQYVTKVFDTMANEWGYSMLKLDFLYAAALGHKKNRPRAAIMRDAMELMRKAAGDTLLLGCGVPLGPAFGLVDYCRIGCDVSLRWEDHFLKLLGARERPSTVCSLASTIGRRQLSGRAFVNDPDVFILRAENNKLSAAQRRSLFLLNTVFGGFVFTSDDPAKYSAAEQRMADSIFPLVEKTVEHVEQQGDLVTARIRVDDRRYFLAANLGKGRKTFEVEDGLWFASGRAPGGGGFVPAGTKLLLEPFDAVCLYSVPSEGVRIAGSEGHVFPGSEIESLAIEGDELVLEVDPRCVVRDIVYIAVDDDRRTLVVNGASYPIAEISGVRVAKIDLAALPQAPRASARRRPDADDDVGEPPRLAVANG